MIVIYFAHPFRELNCPARNELVDSLGDVQRTPDEFLGDNIYVAGSTNLSTEQQRQWSMIHSFVVYE